MKAFDLEIKLTPKAERLLRQLIEGTAPGKLLSSVFNLFERSGSRVAAQIVKNFLSGDPLKRRTGALAQSVEGGAIMRNGVPAMRVGVFRGPALKYAGIQEHGGVIYPKDAKALAMPVNDALTPAGVSKYGGPREYPGKLVYIPFKSGGNVVGALYDAADLKAHQRKLAAVKALYLLLKRVKIPAHWYLRNGVRQFLPEVAVDLVKQLRGTFLGAF